jgi:hypothetical protein
MEVNDYYTKIKPSLREFTADDVIKASAVAPRSPLGPLLLHLLRLAIKVRALLKWPFLIALLCLSTGEIVLLRVLTSRRRPERSRLHRRAAELSAEFTSQYPLWPYSILIKSLAWAFVEEHLPPNSVERKHVLELAIGEGSFSGRIFSGTDEVVGLDVNPVSLSKAVRFPHVRKAVVANCMIPPIHDGAFSVVLANNFLHHVSDKRGTLGRWARLAPLLLFNECTPLWSESWPVPRVLGAIGLRRASRFASDLLNRLGSQDLVPESTLTNLAAEHIDILEKRTYFSENTYMFATLPCVLALNMGAVPEELKRAAQSRPFRKITAKLTAALVRLLIDYDEQQSRGRDVFVSYAGRSRFCTRRYATNGYLRCVRCGQGCLNADQACGRCGHRYASADGMVFLLDADLQHIERSYDPTNAAAFADEHL